MENYYCIMGTCVLFIPKDELECGTDLELMFRSAVLKLRETEDRIHLSCLEHAKDVHFVAFSALISIVAV